MSSPTQRSLALLRKTWALVEVTEKRIPKCFITRDLFGFCDCLAINHDSILAVQTTTSANLSARFEKMRYMPSVTFWLGAPTRLIHLHGWAKRGAKGKRKVWTCRTIELRLNGTGKVEMVEVVPNEPIPIPQRGGDE